MYAALCIDLALVRVGKLDLQPYFTNNVLCEHRCNSIVMWVTIKSKLDFQISPYSLANLPDTWSLIDHDEHLLESFFCCCKTYTFTFSYVDFENVKAPPNIQLSQ